MKGIKFFIFILNFSLLTGCSSGFDSNNNIKLASEGTSSLEKTVNLTWNANTESDLSGYKVYYGDQPDVYLKVLDAGMLVPDSLGKVHFQISGLEMGKLYFFAVSAYDMNNNESDKTESISK